MQSAPTFKLQEEPEEPPAKPAAPAKSSAKPAKETKPAGKDAPAVAAKSPKTDSHPEFSNEFENRFGIEDEGGGGEVLLRVALAEEAEHGVRRRGQKVSEGKVRSGFRVCCPNGHKIEVQERHRGQTGRCPRCRELYHVPAGNWDEERAQQEEKAQKAAAIAAAVKAQGEANQPIEVSAGEFTRWMMDSHFHSLDLAKLKLKPGSLLKDYQEADVGFAPDGMLIVIPTKKGGLFGGGDKKKLSARDAIIDHLSGGKPAKNCRRPLITFSPPPTCLNSVSCSRPLRPSSRCSPASPCSATPRWPSACRGKMKRRIRSSCRSACRSSGGSRRSWKSFTE